MKDCASSPSSIARAPPPPPPGVPFPPERPRLLAELDRAGLALALAGDELVPDRAGEGLGDALALRERLDVGGLEAPPVRESGRDDVRLVLRHPRGGPEETEDRAAGA